MSQNTILWEPWSLETLVADLRSGRTTPADARDRVLERIAETESSLHAWVSTKFAPLPQTISGALSGVPLGVKDIIDLAGHPTRCGSVLRESAAPVLADASIVRAWRGAGAVPMGKTVTTEFAFFSPGPTRNPAAPGHTPGGSSSGSAVAVAAGQLPIALGSQTAGSVTRPASFCGIAALVMSHGRFPADGVVGLAESLDSHGVFAAGVNDLAVAWTALTREKVEAAPPKRILLWDVEDSFPGLASDDMLAAVDEAVFVIRKEGIPVETFTGTGLTIELTEAHQKIMAYEAARERSAELLEEGYLSDPLRRLLHTGSAVREEEYTAARAIVSRGKSKLQSLTREFDFILGPAALGSAPLGLEATGDPILSRAWQAMGLPVVTIPALQDAMGRPLGLQAIGASRAEAELLASTSWIQGLLESTVTRKAVPS